MTNLKAILFDLDGTLIDTVGVILRASEEVCNLMSVPYDETQMRNWIGIPLTVQAELLTGERSLEFIDTYRDVYRKYHKESDRLFDGTLDMLDRLHALGLKTAVVTSKNAPGTNRVLGALGLQGKFEVVISADDIVNPKPHPEPILRGMELLGVGPAESIYVGDSFFDHESAIGAGVPMVTVTWGARTRADLLGLSPAACCDTWGEFLTWVESRTLLRQESAPVGK